ncbi:hypothetical protein GU271_11290 [Vibrio cholerae]|uniref:hypothetical protein n=1 Tax=Vibrio cholerae TaxID=666 RepID=UPI00155EC67F|nr:hypothetical protein [Vibrio cholerae]MBJ6928181.1 hypothetical protein [Vibrio cholerae]MBJ6935459.1 hypothetical protein [Vibrio cholerae]MBJ6963182.1 hypothetical protein [Vibrio cholerae]MDH7615586.1 hypothetical protein [Vibrio cholerae]NOE57211.1 hypothetical protein [Vibrio cholerae]
MPVCSKDFLSLVQSATTVANHEIDYRNIISRSYYGMYHGVLEILTKQPIPIKGVGCHESLKEYLTSYDAKRDEPFDRKDLQRLKTLLEIYKAKRTKADYELDEEICKNEAIACFNALVKFLQQCSSMKAAVTTQPKIKNP